MPLPTRLLSRAGEKAKDVEMIKQNITPYHETSLLLHKARKDVSGKKSYEVLYPLSVVVYVLSSKTTPPWSGPHLPRLHTNPGSINFCT